MNRSSCDHAIAQLYFYLDGEISWIKRGRVQRHLAKCRLCTGAFDFESRLKSIVRERCQEEPQPELLDRLRSLLQDNGEASET